MEELFESIYNEAKETDEQVDETETSDKPVNEDTDKEDKNDKKDDKKEPEKKENTLGGIIDKAKKVAGEVLKNPTVKQVATTVAVGAVTNALRNKGIPTAGVGYGMRGGYYGGASSFGMY